MSTILEFDSIQEKLEIKWEILSNSSSQETPFEEKALDDHQFSEQDVLAENEILELNDSLESKDTLLQDDFPNSLMGEPDDRLGLNLDFLFEFDNPAFLHSFFFTMIFFICLFIILSTLYITPSFQISPISSIAEPKAAASALSFKFEALGQGAGKAIDRTINYVFDYFQSEGFHQKVAEYSDIANKMVEFGGSAFKKHSWLWSWMQPEPLFMIHDPCKEKLGIFNKFLYQICSFFWPPSLVAPPSSASTCSFFSDWFGRMRSLS